MVDAILNLDLWQLGVLALMAVVAHVLLGFAFRNTLSNLGIKDATLGMLASLAVKGSIPGPMDTVFRFRLAVAYGLVLYWQKRDHFSLLSADSAQYAGKGDPAHDEVTP